MWAFTDNPDFKGLKSFADGLAWQPDHFVDRLGQLLQSNATVSIHGFVDIIGEVLGLVDLHLSTVDTSGEQGTLKQVMNRGTR